MKGTLVKRNTGDWVVWWTDSTAKNGVRILPLLQEDAAGLFIQDTDDKYEGLKVEFEIVEQFMPYDNFKPIHKYAKLIDDDLSAWDATLMDGLEEVEWDTKPGFVEKRMALRAQSIKDKAKELYNKYADEFNFDDTYRGYREQSKQCALIAIDEIINTLNSDIRDLDVRGNILLDLIEYWREIKQEIEKL
jgi:hypothetical protein